MFAMIPLPKSRCLALVLTILLGLLGAGTTNAATYFVDYANGDDTATGTATDAPWQHSPGDSAATGIPATKTLASGDVVNFKGGVVYLLTSKSTGIMAVSGVTYDGAAWGSGKAIMTDSNAPVGHSAFGLYSAQSNVVIQSFVVTNLGGALNLPPDTGSRVAANPGVGVNMSGGQHNIIVNNCDFAQLGYWQNVKPVGVDSINGAGVSIVGNGLETSSIIVSNCTFRRMHTGVSLQSNPSLSNIAVANCQFTDSFVWCVDITVGANNSTTAFVSVHDCTFYDYYQYNNSTWAGYPDGSGPHVDGIFLRCDYPNGAIYGTNINLYNNLFYSTAGTGGGTAQIYVTEGPSCNIFGNVFIHSGMSDGNIYLNNGPNGATSHQYVNIFNNTFLDSYTLNVYATTDSSDRPVQSLKMVNNIFYDTVKGSGANWLFSLYVGTDASQYTNWFVDYNVYKSFNTSLPAGAGGGFYNGGPWTFTQCRTYMGWDTHSIIADPAFKNITASTPIQNLQVAAGSPALSAGTNLTSWLINSGIPAVDRNGNTRPASGTWDIGAYQLNGNKPPPAAPQLLPVKSNK